MKSKKTAPAKKETKKTSPKTIKNAAKPTKKPVAAPAKANKPAKTPEIPLNEITLELFSIIFLMCRRSS